MRPTLALAVVSEEVSAAPAGDPEGAVAVALDTTAALARDRWLQDRDAAGLEIDLAEIVAGERGKEHLAIRGGGDAIGPGAARRIKHCHRARFGIKPAVDAFLPGEPEHALAIEAAVLRLALRRSLGSGKSFTPRVAGSTRAIAFCPPSVTQAAPSGPTITPCGAAPGPSAIRSDLPVLGLSWPSLPADCAVIQTVPSGAG